MFGTDPRSGRQKVSSVYKVLPVESYSLYPQGKIRVMLLNPFRNQKERVGEERVADLSQSVPGFSPNSSHPPSLPVPVPEGREQYFPGK